MVLHVGSLAWPATFPNRPTYPSLEKNITCDCLIIGGGVGGALSTYKLQSRGMDTVIVDKHVMAGGSTAANTGILQYTNDKSLTSCIHTFGEATGVAFYRLCQQALTQLRSLHQELSADTDFIPRSSLYFASTEEDLPALRTEWETLSKYGFEAEWWDAQQIGAHFPFTKPAGIITHGDAEVNPYKFTLSVLEAASKRGARVFENTEITSYRFHDDHVTCYTRNGTIKAKHVIFATGYETQEIKRDQGAVLTTTFAVVTKPVPDLSTWYDRYMIWETARPYLYMRTTPDHRIVIGGLDEPLLAPNDAQIRLLHHSKRLVHEAEALFPDLAPLEIEYAWASTFGSTRDGLPLFGQHESYPHCYFLEAYGGNGTVYSMIGAELLADTLTGTKRPEMELFSLTRSSKPAPDQQTQLF